MISCVITGNIPVAWSGFGTHSWDARASVLGGLYLPPHHTLPLPINLKLTSCLLYRANLIKLVLLDVSYRFLCPSCRLLLESSTGPGEDNSVCHTVASTFCSHVGLSDASGPFSPQTGRRRTEGPGFNRASNRDHRDQLRDLFSTGPFTGSCRCVSAVSIIYWMKENTSQEFWDVLLCPGIRFYRKRWRRC